MSVPARYLKRADLVPGEVLSLAWHRRLWNRAGEVTSTTGVICFWQGHSGVHDLTGRDRSRPEDMVAMTASSTHSVHGSGLLPQRRGLRGAWYFPVTFLSCGLLAWVPFAHAAARLRSRARAIQAAAYAGLSALAVVMISVAPVDAAGNTHGFGTVEEAVAVFSLIGLLTGGLAQQVTLRREAYEAKVPQHARRRARPVDPEVTRVLEARDKRATARKIAATDPLMAHELRIGRPDLPRAYDDGGLVDLNNASAKAIAKACELEPGVARAIVDARTTSGFLSVDDVFSLVEIPLPTWAIVRDRAMIITL